MVRVVGGPSLQQDNDLRSSWTNLVRGRVKSIDNGSAEQQRSPQVKTTSEFDLITCIRIIELEGLVLFTITCLVCLLIHLFIICLLISMLKKYFLQSTLSSCICFLFGFHFCDDHQNWCKHMWRFLEIIQMVVMVLSSSCVLVIAFLNIFWRNCYLSNSLFCEQSCWTTVLCLSYV